MTERWIILGQLGDAKAARKEMDEILAHDKNPKLQIEGAYIRAREEFRVSIKDEKGGLSKAANCIQKRELRSRSSKGFSSSLRMIHAARHCSGMSRE